MEKTPFQNVCYRVPPEVVYREVDGEVVVLNSEIGEFYFFSPDIKPVLDSLRQPANIVTSGLSALEKKNLDEVLFLLKQKHLIDSAEPTADTASVTILKSPQFLRKGDKTLDEIADGVALLTSFTG